MTGINTISLEVKRVVTFKPVITIVTPKPFDFTGWGAWSQWRPDIDSTELINEFKVSNGGVIFNAQTQTVQLVLSDAQRETILDAGYKKAVHEILLVNPAGDTFEWVEGPVTFKNSVMRNVG